MPCVWSSDDWTGPTAGLRFACWLGRLINSEFQWKAEQMYHMDVSCMVAIRVATGAVLMLTIPTFTPSTHMRTHTHTRTQGRAWEGERETCIICATFRGHNYASVFWGCLLAKVLISFFFFFVLSLCHAIYYFITSLETDRYTHTHTNMYTQTEKRNKTCICWREFHYKSFNRVYYTIRH